MTNVIYVMQGGNVQPLVDYNSLDIHLTTKGLLTGSLVSLNTTTNAAHNILIEESIVVIDDYSFIVKQLNETTYHKRVELVSTYYNLADKQKKQTFAGTRTIKELLDYVFNGVDWSYTIDFNDSITIPNFGIGNVVELVETIATLFKTDYEIRRNNIVHFSRNLGGDNQKVYWYGHNVKALEKITDTTKLKTYIEGYGADNVFASYTSPNAAIFGIREAETIYNEEYLDSNSLRTHLASQIIDYPEMSFELDSIELLETEIGEKVWLIYEPLNIELQTRILEQHLTIIDNDLRVYKVTLGNKIPYNTNDVILDNIKDLNETKRRFRSRFEQTDERITLEVEEIGVSIATLELTSEQISNRVTNNTGAIGQLNIRADGIQASVNNNNGQISALNIKADGIQSQVTNNANNTQSQFTQLSNQINLKVNVGGTINDINVNGAGVQINANRIDLNGAVIVNGSISGATSINVQNDITVGATLQVGQSYQGSFPKAIRFGGESGSAGIGYAYDVLTVSAVRDIVLDADNIVFRGNVSGLASSRTSGLGFGYSSANNRLYVSINGADVGFVQLT